jgi:hypothetical protein
MRCCVAYNNRLKGRLLCGISGTFLQNRLAFCHLRAVIEPSIGTFKKKFDARWYIRTPTVYQRDIRYTRAHFNDLNGILGTGEAGGGQKPDNNHDRNPDEASLVELLGG